MMDGFIKQIDNIESALRHAVFNSLFGTVSKYLSGVLGDHSFFEFIRDTFIDYETRIQNSKIPDRNPRYHYKSRIKELKMIRKGVFPN